MCMQVNLPTLQLPTKTYSWPGTGTDVQDTVEACMGPRVYAGHPNGYDFLNGLDTIASAGQFAHAIMPGPISRLTWQFYGWESAQQIARWSITNGSDATFALSGPTTLLITGARTGAKAYPATSTNFTDLANAYDVGTNDWFRQVSFTAPLSIAGGVFGFGVRDLVSGEYAAMEYDGTTITCRGKKATGIMSSDGFTAAVPGATAIWLMIYYTKSANTITWQYSTDQTTWTTIRTQGAAIFTRTGYPAFHAEEYWCPLDVNAAPQTIQVDNDNSSDNATPPGLSRFGNFLQITHNDEKFIICHLQEPLVTSGAFLEAGQPFGIVGKTGWDTFSGPIDHIHIHNERALNNNYFYVRVEEINMAVPGCLPGVALTGNVSAVRSTGNDPLGQTSVIYTVTVARANQDFYANTFVMVGTLGTGLINYNTRAGLNVDVDNPSGNGMYQVPSVFNGASPSKIVTYYFNIATYGTFISGQILDPVGNVLFTVT